MPVVIRPDPAIVGKSEDRPASGRDFFDRLFNEDNSRTILQTSVTDTDVGTVVPFKSGFVRTVLRAWQQHLHLELRPDDVWLAVLVQFSFFVNGHAEALRHHFVAHEGKRRLTVAMAFLTDRLVALARQQMVDPDLCDWMLPTFSTTLPHDRLTAAAVFLGTMQQYFGYGLCIDCGFPSVTLRGERGDWAELAKRVARLAEFDDAGAAGDVTEWSRALGVAVGMMVESFDRPADDDVGEFWMRACHSAGSEMSGGVTTLSGWLTTFCWWRADGSRQKAYDDAELASMWQEDWRRLRLRGVNFPVIDQDEVPVGITRVPVTFYGDKDAEGKDTQTILLAGSTGMKIIDGEATRVSPFSSWWLLGEPEGSTSQSITTSCEGPEKESTFGRTCA
ncbi:hypothetical protein CSOJ01_12476 [Colletotrichum sojae]|uniref:Uncharacterized protein n=1 Tax=Colletotrichum sojae TaxID=2175907 RepID=A0A8H6MLJ7_9PEZI|nr:hypothetical protein CSOJ01_12476 [Colletotrichum sojae]